MALSYLGYHAAGGSWNTALDDADKKQGGSQMLAEDVWYGERFQRLDEATGEVKLSSRDLAGRYFPFGGGVHMCPGRVFARQEILGVVAGFLDRFEVRFDRWVGAQGEAIGTGADGFPGIKRQYAGNGIVHLEGDADVRIRRRRDW